MDPSPVGGGSLLRPLQHRGGAHRGRGGAHRRRGGAHRGGRQRKAKEAEKAKKKELQQPTEENSSGTGVTETKRSYEEVVLQ